MLYILSLILGGFVCIDCMAQELQAKININTQKVGVTDKSVFDNLQQNLEQFVNDRQWTELQFQKNERIVCNFNITVNKYDKMSNTFECTALIQANRPVYNSQYTTTLYNNTDNNFNFEYAEFDQLNFNEEMIDNQLTALMAYYAYLIIGLDLDCSVACISPTMPRTSHSPVGKPLTTVVTDLPSSTTISTRV